MTTPTAVARRVRVPGEPPKAEETETLADTLNDADKSTVKALMEPNAAAEVNDEVAHLKAQLAQANAEKAKLQAQVNAGQDDNTVIRSIGSSKLTPKGWVVPADFGAPAIKAH